MHFVHHCHPYIFLNSMKSFLFLVIICLRFLTCTTDGVFIPPAPAITSSSLPGIIHHTSSSLPGIIHNTGSTNNAPDAANTIIGSAMGAIIALLLVVIITTCLPTMFVFWRNRKMSRNNMDIALRYSYMYTNYYRLSMYAITFALLFTFNQSDRTGMWVYFFGSVSNE